MTFKLCKFQILFQVACLTSACMLESNGIGDVFTKFNICTNTETTCTDSTLTQCVDGEELVVSCLIGCAPSQDRCLHLVPSNVNEPFDASVPEIAIRSDATFTTTSCTHSTWTTQVISQPYGPELCMVVGSSLSISDSVTLLVTGERPVVFIIDGDVIIDGTIDVSANMKTPGPGGYIGGVGEGFELTDECHGQGPGGGGGGIHANIYIDTGGGGGGMCGHGGSGGNVGEIRGGFLGVISSYWDLIPLQGGSGGGDGSGDKGYGGAGGGALQISSKTSISLKGLILAGGGGGQGGGNVGAGGGGGSGGAILLEAPVIEILSSAVLRAVGGGGGGAGFLDYGSGNPGQNGATAAIYAEGGTPSSNWAGSGGRSGGGNTLSGESGGDGGETNGGGGGGSAGCIMLRNASGILPDNAASISSPSVAPGLRVLPAKII